MRHKRKSWYEREVDALTDRVNARMFVTDVQTSLAMDLIILATLVGADAVRLAEKTGVLIDQIRPLENRLREALVWNRKTVDSREWRHMDYRDRILVIFIQAKVALGALKRVQRDGYAIYMGRDDRELVRFPIPEDSRILCRFAREAVWFDLASAWALLTKLQLVSEGCAYPSLRSLMLT